jgi:hypothetical protein
MCAQLHTHSLNIALPLNLNTTVQHSCALPLIQHNNIVTQPISCTIHIHMSVTLSLLHLQFPQHTTMLSIAQRPNHTTTKLALSVQPLHL